MAAIVLVSVINHYHINGLHLLGDTLYKLPTRIFFIIVDVLKLSYIIIF